MWPFKKKTEVQVPILDTLSAYPPLKPKVDETAGELKALRSLLATVLDQTSSTATYVGSIQQTLPGQLRDIRDRLPDADEAHERTLTNIVAGMAQFPHDAIKHLPNDPSPTRYSEDYLRGVDDLRKYVNQIIDGR
jgi:hypothetical protein